MKTSTRQNLKPAGHQLPQPRTLSPSTVDLPVTNSPAITLEPAAGHKVSRMPAPSFEITLESMHLRQEAKTTILEEALQRSEQAQQRFWGINE